MTKPQKVAYLTMNAWQFTVKAVFSFCLYTPLFDRTSIDNPPKIRTPPAPATAAVNSQVPAVGIPEEVSGKAALVVIVGVGVRVGVAVVTVIVPVGVGKSPFVGVAVGIAVGEGARVAEGDEVNSRSDWKLSLSRGAPMLLSAILASIATVNLRTIFRRVPVLST
jgi:hypothetical protein